MKLLKSFALIVCTLAFPNYALSQDQVLEDAVADFISFNKLTGLNSVAIKIWEFEVSQSKSCIDEVCKQWQLSVNDEERDCVVQLFRSEKCNVWSIDPSTSGVLRKFMIGANVDVLNEIQEYSSKKIGLKLRAIDSELPMDRESILIRIRNDFYIGQKIDRLMGDVRSAGILSIGKPGFENIADIPKQILEAIPNASDRQKLTGTSTVEFWEANTYYTYIIVNGNVIKLIKSYK